MKRLFTVIGLLFLFSKSSFAAQATITEAEGSACMGEDKSRRQTEQAALIDAKQKAVEFASTHIKGETQVNNFQIKKDLLESYSNADVKIITEIKKSWYKSATLGDCFKIKIKAEVTPTTASMKTNDTANDRMQIYSLQERCKEKAYKEFYNRFYKDIDINIYKFPYIPNYWNHYNSGSNKCYVLIKYALNLGDKLDEPVMMLIDVNEGGIVGSCMEGEPNKCISEEWKTLMHETMEE